MKEIVIEELKKSTVDTVVTAAETPTTVMLPSKVSKRKENNQNISQASKRMKALESEEVEKTASDVVVIHSQISASVAEDSAVISEPVIYEPVISPSTSLVPSTHFVDSAIMHTTTESLDILEHDIVELEDQMSGHFAQFAELKRRGLFNDEQIEVKAPNVVPPSMIMEKAYASFPWFLSLYPQDPSSFNFKSQQTSEEKQKKALELTQMLISLCIGVEDLCNQSIRELRYQKNIRDNLRKHGFNTQLIDPFLDTIFELRQLEMEEEDYLAMLSETNARQKEAKKKYEEIAPQMEIYNQCIEESKIVHQELIHVTEEIARLTSQKVQLEQRAQTLQQQREASIEMVKHQKKINQIIATTQFGKEMSQEAIDQMRTHKQVLQRQLKNLGFQS